MSASFQQRVRRALADGGASEEAFMRVESALAAEPAWFADPDEPEPPPPARPRVDPALIEERERLLREFQACRRPDADLELRLARSERAVDVTLVRAWRDWDRAVADVRARNAERERRRVADRRAKALWQSEVMRLAYR